MAKLYSLGSNKPRFRFSTVVTKNYGFRFRFGNRHSTIGNSADKLRHTGSVAYSVELVLLTKHRISGGGACPHCYRYFCND